MGRSKGPNLSKMRENRVIWAHFGLIWANFTPIWAIFEQIGVILG